MSRPRRKQAEAPVAAEPPPAARTDAEIEEALAKVEHTDDIVEFALRCLFAMAPQFGDEVREATNRRVREAFGGERLYISKNDGEIRAKRNEQIRADHQRGERISLLARRYELTIAQVWKIVHGGTR